MAWFYSGGDWPMQPTSDMGQWLAWAGAALMITLLLYMMRRMMR
jgi:uncharacterized membrane protein YjfL (UPF0719 family)